MRRNVEPFKKLFRSVITIILVFLQTGVFAYSWISEYNNYIVLPFVQKGNLLIYAIYAVLFIAFVKSFDGLRYGTYRKLNLIIAQVLAIISTSVVIYLQIVLLAAGLVTVEPLIQTIVINSIISVAIIFIAHYLFRFLFPARKTLVVYDQYSPELFLSKLSTRKDKFIIQNVETIPLDIEKLKNLIAESECVIIYDVHSEKRNKVLKICFENNVRTYTTSKVSDILIRGAEKVHLFDTPLLLYRNMGLTFEQRFLKRCMDIIVSLIMIILSSPFLIFSALAIKLYDGGPIFFRQARGTINGKIFYIHKFRSMIVDAERDNSPQPATNDDPRITPVGRFLRASRLDELPQLFDILVGNMSLVGPRPERIDHIRQYTDEIPEFQYRLKVKGGLTGYAQLYGKYNTTPYDKLQLDLMYIQNYSLLMDIKLILMTVKIMFMRESTEGFTEENSKKITEKSNKEES